MKANRFFRSLILLSNLIFLTLSFSSCMVSKCRYSNGFRIDFVSGKSEQVTYIKKTKTKKWGAPKVEFKDSGLTIFHKELPLVSDTTRELEIQFVSVFNPINNNKTFNTLYSENIKVKDQNRDKLTSIFKNKPEKSNSEVNHFGVIRVLLEIIKFFIFTAISIGVFLLVLVGALFFASLNTGIILALLILLLSFVFLLALIYELFGYGPMEDVFNFFGSLFWI